MIWVGTGENASQRSAHFGDGIYKSTDAGKTWKRMGLEKSEHLGQILIDPRNSNVVYVAAQGPLWSAGGERGLYKTTDGGAKWDRRAYDQRRHGYQRRRVSIRRIPTSCMRPPISGARAVGQMIGGGPEGGIFKSTDSGKNLDQAAKNGLPKDDVGRVALGVDPKNPARVYALISAKMPRGRVRSVGGGAGGFAPENAAPGAGVERRRWSPKRASIVPTTRGATWVRIGKVAIRRPAAAAAARRLAHPLRQRPPAPQ